MLLSTATITTTNSNKKMEVSDHIGRICGRKSTMFI